MTVGAKLSVDGAGPDAAASQVAISAGWGSTATKALLAGSNDAAGKVTVTSAGTGQAADATITFTFAKAKDRAPVVVCQRSDDDQAAGDVRVTDTSTTGFVVTFEGTAVAAEVYEIQYVVVEI